MPLYELVLRYADRDEVRLTDHNPVHGGYAWIDERRWQVIADEDSTRAGVERRYILRPTANHVGRP